MPCISDLNFYIKLNGVVGSNFITLKRGLRQGCSLSLYIFILVMEVPSQMLMKAQTKGHFKRIRLSDGAPSIPHYA
jgi:hypothetical protein